MKKVLVVNRGNCDNLGDQAINLAMQGFIIKESKCEVKFEEFTTLAKEPKRIEIPNINVRIKNKVKVLLKKLLPLKAIWVIRNFFRIKKAVNSDIDIVIVGGGQLILSNSAFDIASALWVYLSKKYNKKIIFCSVGSGTNFSMINKALYGYALKYCDGICVRDVKSKETLKNIFNVESFVSGDIVFTNQYEEKNTVKKELVLLGIPCLSVYNHYNSNVSHEQYYEIWLEFINDNKVNIKDCTLFYTTYADYVESVNFNVMLENKYGFALPVTDANNLEKLELLMDSSRLVLSGRMHGLIIAINNGADVIPFPISKKIESFKDILTDNANLEEYKINVNNETRAFLLPFIA